MERKQGIVRQLVHQWKYMYEHDVFQCELLDHIYYSMSDNQTAIIDFQSHRVLPPHWPRPTKDNWHRRQLKQLMTMIANICTTPPDALRLDLRLRPFRTEDSICNNHHAALGRFPNVSFVQSVVNATRQWCKFNPRLPWGNLTSQAAINDTTRMYQDLSDWSRGIGAK